MNIVKVWNHPNLGNPPDFVRENPFVVHLRIDATSYRLVMSDEGLIIYTDQQLIVLPKSSNQIVLKEVAWDQ